MKRTPPPAPTYACTVTPPMTLPSRGWGDRDSGSEGCGVRHFSGFSCHSAADTGSITGSCSSSGSSCSHGSGSAAGTGGAGGGVGSGGRLRNSTGIGCGGRELKPFHLSDGFSSAEEETWGSEGEVRVMIWRFSGGYLDTGASAVLGYWWKQAWIARWPHGVGLCRSGWFSSHLALLPELPLVCWRRRVLLFAAPARERWFLSPPLSAPNACKRAHSTSFSTISS